MRLGNDPSTWPEFGELHPFCPPEQAQGYHQMIEQLSHWLVQLTGYDAVYATNSGLKVNMPVYWLFVAIMRVAMKGAKYLFDPGFCSRYQSCLCAYGRYGGGGSAL